METPEELLVHLVDALEYLDIPYAIGGSLAAIAYGEPRSTRDIDVVVALRSGDIPRLRARFPPEDYYLDEKAASEALRRKTQFNIIHPRSGFKIDLYVAGDEISHAQISDARRLPAAGSRTARFSPPEPLILKKLQFHQAGASDKHLRDVLAILGVSGDLVDRERLTEEARRFGLSQLLADLLRRSREE
ncbi:MAG: hypothetical protein ACRELC_02080 [Gemmatimonadota bacterium]